MFIYSHSKLTHFPFHRNETFEYKYAVQNMTYDLSTVVLSEVSNAGNTKKICRKGGSLMKNISILFRQEQRGNGDARGEVIE